MKRAGFTMIELIFVIVILGILAAVAIPKLSATRDDANIAKMATNAATAVSDIGAYYTSQGSFANWSSMTNVPLETSAGTPITSTTAASTRVLLTDGTNNCLTFDLNSTGGSLTVAAPGTLIGNICTTVKSKVANLLKTHTFGGTGVSY
ncbi:MAG: prepilin-type N-terminal cleavage/methylation domain-containing protein [Epsilonproteobacteria bacterium]|nr:prepilin-type N-terminal cleavage/methylation domain-containing protein [Campylobacterota bacterium]